MYHRRPIIRDDSSTKNRSKVQLGKFRGIDKRVNLFEEEGWGGGEGEGWH